MENLADNITHVIRTRRSIFPASYIEKEIPKEIIEEMLTNANFAPTHKLTEPWRFVIFRGESLKKLALFFSERYKSVTSPENFSQEKYDMAGEKVLKSGCVIAVNAELHGDKIPEWEEVAALACAVQNMWLTASAYGIGSYWSSPAILGLLGEFLELPDNQKCFGLYYMGYHNAELPPAKRTPIENKVTWMN